MSNKNENFHLLQEPPDEFLDPLNGPRGPPQRSLRGSDEKKTNLKFAMAELEHLQLEWSNTSNTQGCQPKKHMTYDASTLINLLWCLLVVVSLPFLARWPAKVTKIQLAQGFEIWVSKSCKSFCNIHFQQFLLALTEKQAFIYTIFTHCKIFSGPDVVQDR